MGALDSLAGGYQNPVFDSQEAFRKLLDAMANPGRVVPVRPLTAPPAPLSPMAAALAAALCDADTSLFLDKPLAGSAAVVAWLRFHVGAPIVATPGAADFAILAEPAGAPALCRFRQGTDEYPDRSTTLILQVESLSEGKELWLEGPGIATRAKLAPAPLPPGFADLWRANGALYPRGLDLVFAAPDAIAAMPRTSRIVEG